MSFNRQPTRHSEKIKKMTLDLSTLYASTGQAKLAHMEDYVRQAVEAVPPGAVVTLAGPGPVWLLPQGCTCRLVEHQSLSFMSRRLPGAVEIFNHNPR